MSVTLLAIVTDVSAVHPLKAPSPNNRVSVNKVNDNDNDGGDDGDSDYGDQLQ